MTPRSIVTLQPRPPPRITVAYSAAETIQALQRQTTQTVGLMAWVILIGALLSHWLGRSLDQQFVKVLAPIFRHQARQGSGKASLYAVPSLATSVILELNAMVKLINSRLVRVNRLSLELEDMNSQARDTLARNCIT